MKSNFNPNKFFTTVNQAFIFYNSLSEEDIKKYPDKIVSWLENKPVESINVALEYIEFDSNIKNKRLLDLEDYEYNKNIYLFNTLLDKIVQTPEKSVLVLNNLFAVSDKFKGHFKLKSHRMINHSIIFDRLYNSAIKDSEFNNFVESSNMKHGYTGQLEDRMAIAIDKFPKKK